MANSSGDETRPTESGIASDDTQLADPSNPTPSPSNTTGRVIRASRSSVGPNRLGRYAIVRPLGRGGMGAVYEAEDPELGRRVAIKVLREDRDDARYTEQLRREAQALAKLVHAHVVGVHDVGVADGQVFVVMQLVDGETIDRWLRARRAGASQIVAAFRQAGQGLAAAHAAGLVHCDFKPANVLVDKDGVVRVSDFGLARIGDEPGTIAGTPAYMAPEQFTGTATAASDQYSFCAALWEVLAGAQPFADSTLDNVGARVLPPMPRDARVPPRIVRALERGLAKDPAQRFASMDELLAALAPPMRRGVWIAAGSGAVALGVAAIVLTGRSADKAAPPKPPAPGEADLAAARALTHYGHAVCAYAPTIDGTNVVFDRTEGDADDIYVVPVAGGAARQLTSAATNEWRAHAGRHAGEVVHLVTDPKEQTPANVSYLDLATGHETLAAEVTAADAVSTTAGIVYVQPGGFALRRNDGKQDLLLVDAPKGHELQDIAVSKSRDRIAAIAYDENGGRLLCTVDVPLAKVECSALPALAARPAFGADDRFLYYPQKDGIHRREVANGADALVVPDVRPAGGIAISDDGSALVYSDCGERAQIEDLSVTPPAVIVDDPSAHTPRAAAGTLAWIRYIRGVQVIVARVGNDKESQVTDPSFGPVNDLALSPDGHMVAYASGPPHPGIYVSSLGGERQRISENPHDAGPVFVGNDWIAFNRLDHDESTVFVATVDGGQLHALTGSERHAVGGRDGRVLAGGARNLYWIDLKTGREMLTPDVPVKNASAYQTSPGGRWLLVKAGETASMLYRMPLDGKAKAEQLPDLPAGQNLISAGITDDGRVLVSTQTWSGDLHVVPAKPGTRY